MECFLAGSVEDQAVTFRAGETSALRFVNTLDFLKAEVWSADISQNLKKRRPLKPGRRDKHFD
jgi:hypothetical protein